MALDLGALKEGFAYDLWANELWIEFLDRRGRPEPDWTVMTHLIAVQKLWLMRCQGNPPAKPPSVELASATLEAIRSDWIAHLSSVTGDPAVDYRNFAGVPHRAPLSCIARHVLDHGTYHRGELRGICRARNDEEFPETGLHGYFVAEGQIAQRSEA